MARSSAFERDSHMAHSISDILAIVRDARVVGRSDLTFTHARPLEAANTESLVWLSPKKHDQATDILRATAASFIIASASITPPEDVLARACLILVAAPRLAFARVVRALFGHPRHPPGVHPTATIHPDARIDESAWIGPHCYVGRSTIGAECVLDGHVHIADACTLGQRVWVGPQAVIGVDGFGFVADEEGDWVHFPHLGGVVLGDDVRLGAHACVVRGSLGDTVVGPGTKLDNFVTVGHNARVGARVLVASHSIVGGSSSIGDDAWVSPHATILNGIKVGAKAVVGAGACVVGDVPDGAKVIGPPARTLPQAMWKLRAPLA